MSKMSKHWFVVSNAELRWFEFDKYREQACMHVTLMDKHRQRKQLCIYACGVPQESILGPLLFLLDM